MRTSKTLTEILAFGLTIAVWAGSQSLLQAQFGGLQIGIGRVGGVYAGSGFQLGGLNVPFGVGPSIPPSSQAFMGPQAYSGYRGYYGSYSPLPTLGGSGYSTYEYAAPGYRNFSGGAFSGSGPYAGDGVLNYQHALHQLQLQLQAEQLRLAMPQRYPHPAQMGGGAQYANKQHANEQYLNEQYLNDLRPGMVLPDGSTVISVAPLAPTSEPLAPQSAPPVPKSNRANRAAF